MKLSNLAWIVGAVVVATVAGLASSWLLFPSPLAPGEVEVPQLRGIASKQAVTELAAAGLRGRLAGTPIDDPLTPSGTVSWHSPVAGTVVPESTIVIIGVSSGTPRVMVPELIDLDTHAAPQILRAAGLGVGDIDSVHSSRPAGVIIGTRPEARQPIRSGSNVELIISKGPRSSQ